VTVGSWAAVHLRRGIVELWESSGGNEDYFQEDITEEKFEMQKLKKNW
jgi:hypothetical protein